MTSNLYKVGDWVYCEISPFQPYVIRKIEELTKTPNGNVEAKVLCAFRLHDIPTNVLQSVERYQPKTAAANAVTAPPATATPSSTDIKTDGTTTPADTTVATTTPSATATTPANTNSATVIYFEEHEVADLNEQQRYNLKHREVFYSKYTDTIAATSIRAKCSVLLFNEEVEKYSEYLGKDDSFFYHLTYDPYQKSLVNDKGEIRVGFRFQTEIPPLRPNTNGLSITSGLTEEQLALEQIEKKEANDRITRSRASLPASALLPEIPILAQTEELLQWCPLGLSLNGYTNRLDEDEIDKFVLLTKSVGTFARALDTTSSLKQPSLHQSAASASRDITIQHAMNLLHESNYDIGKAALSLVSGEGPVLCRDEGEEWSIAEANLFEDALDKYGKDFNEIRKDYLPWRSIKSIIEYYYIWKTTDRYLQRKTTKVAEQESKLKQVYIPNASKQNQSALIKTAHVHLFQQYDVHLKNSCESCGAPSQSTNQWYAYNPTNLVQQIMNGNSNPQALAAAQAQAIANIIANQTNPNTANVSIYQARLCADCWVYYKKFSLFKYANARQERLNQLKNQVHKCSVNGCGKEFKAKQLLIKHCGIAHGYFAKAATNPQNGDTRPQAIRNRTAFYLLTTPMTRASRLVCTGTVKLKRLAKKPFKLVDLSELNKEWSKENNRNITDLLEKRQKQVDAMASSCQARRKLHVKLIDSVAKNRSKLLKSNGKEHHNGGTNGHNGHAHDAEDSNDLVIDQATDDDHQNDQPKPEYFKYFEQKCTTPCYTPDRFAFPKPSADQINKYFLNLMSQNRKRTLEQANNEKLANGNASIIANSNGQSNDSDGPVTKRSLLNNEANHVADKEVIGQQQPQQPMRQALKTSSKPVQSRYLPLSKLDEEFFYIGVSPVKEVRNQIKMSVLRQLARSPTKSMSGNNQNLYSTVEKAVDSWRQTHPSKVNGHNGNNNDIDSQSGDNHSENHQNGVESASSNGKLKSETTKDVTAVTGGSMVVLD